MNKIEKHGDTVNCVFAIADKHFMALGEGYGKIDNGPAVFVSIQRGYSEKGVTVRKSASDATYFGDRVCLWFNRTESIDCVIDRLKKIKKQLKILKAKK